ncbi:MAG: histidine--tRNA ligase family protein, partial [Treponema sp.]|nr:histidine--tRNA ligase family protein [Treponema sp.]
IGSDSISSDFEILQVIHSSFLALGINDFKIHINDRAIFNQFLSHLGLQKNSEDILRTVDKLSKIGKDSVKNELSAITQSKDTAEKILSYITLEKDFSSTLQKITSLAGSETEDVKRMKSLYEMIKACNLENYFILDPSITRGLDYYTGIVYETFLENAKDIGSVCSGGRYNNLCGLYTKTSISGVGASIGLDRLIACLEKLNNTECVKSYINAEIFFTNEEHFLHYQKLANTLRKNGISVEVFPENKKMQTQYTLAERKGIKWGILVNDEDIANNTFTLKNLLTREMFESISIEEGVSRILGK